MSPIFDTDAKRAVVRRLTDALYDFLTFDCDMAEKFVKMNPQAEYKPPNLAKQLTDAVADRDRLAERIAECRHRLTDVPEMLRPAMEMGVIKPIEESLRRCEEYISELQARIESAATASMLGL